MQRRVLLFALVFALGLVVGGVGSTMQESPTIAYAGDDSIPLSVSTGTGCVEDLDTNGGWVHEVVAGESADVTLNATVVHDNQQTVDVNVTEISPDVYRISIRTVPVDRDTKAAVGCQPRTELEIGTALPTDYKELLVSVDDTVLLTAVRNDTTADLYQLPHPIDATRSLNTTDTAD